MAGFSKILAPAWVLVLVVLLAGMAAGLGVGGTAVLAAAIVGIPGVTYKKFPLIASACSVPHRWRTRIVALQILIVAAACMLLEVPAPVPATVMGLFGGNVALALARKRLNASAHVSVLTFAVLWAVAVFGPSLAGLLLLVPVMLASRIMLRQHTWAEGLAGMLIGCAVFACFVVANTLI